MGSAVIMDHDDGEYTVYGHLGNISVVPSSQPIGAGTIIGTVGYSGNAIGLQSAGLPPHLHFAVIRAARTGLASANGPLAQMKNWGDYWLDTFGPDLLIGPIPPSLVVGNGCWRDPLEGAVWQRVGGQPGEIQLEFKRTGYTHYVGTVQTNAQKVMLAAFDIDKASARPVILRTQTGALVFTGSFDPHFTQTSGTVNASGGTVVLTRQTGSISSGAAPVAPTNLSVIQ